MDLGAWWLKSYRPRRSGAARLVSMAASVMLFDSFVAGSWPLSFGWPPLRVLGGMYYAAAALVLDRQLPTELCAFWAMRSQIRGLAASSERPT